MNKQTNAALVTELMEFSKSGALMQSFILTALEKYAQQVIAAAPEDWKANGFISFEAWKACATELDARLNEHFK